MAWRVKILPTVRRKINGLHASGAISRRELIDVYNTLYLELPHRARRLRANRYAPDPDCFVFVVRFHSRNIWNQFAFHVRDTIRPGLLEVEDVKFKVVP